MDTVHHCTCNRMNNSHDYWKDFYLGVSCFGALWLAAYLYLRNTIITYHIQVTSDRFGFNTALCGFWYCTCRFYILTCDEQHYSNSHYASVTYSIVQKGLTSHSIHYTSLRRRLSSQALDWWKSHSAGPSNQITTEKYLNDN